MWFVISITIRSLLSILLLVAGGCAAFRPIREIERRWDRIRPYAYLERQRVGVVLATCLLVALVWLV